MRFVTRLFARLAWWQQLAVVTATPVLALNLAVAFFGQTIIFPLSPFSLEAKWHALTSYARHRPHCLLSGHPDSRTVAAQAELRYGLPKGLMQAVVEVESEGRPHRISPTGAMGAAQLMPGTAKMLEVKDAFDTTDGIDGGARYLSQLLRRMHSVKLAVAAYNAGPGAVNGAVPRNGETEVYVARVLRHFEGRD